MPNLKILIVVYPLTGKGGIFRRLTLWTKYLPKEYSIRILTFTKRKSVIRKLESNGIEVCTSDSFDRIGRILIVPAGLKFHSELMSFSPHIVFSMFLWPDIITSLFMRWFRLHKRNSVPHLVHIAGDPVPFHSHVLLKKVYSWLLRKAYNQADRVICICDHDRQTYSSKYGIQIQMIETISIGVDLGQSEEKPTVEQPLQLGIVSRLSPEKNVDKIMLMLESMQGHANLTFHLHIYGDGVELNRLKKLASGLTIEKDITFHGWVPDPSQSFQAIDCLLMFSETEGTPRSILEAAVAGVPTVARAVGGVSEMIIDGRTGFTVSSETEFSDRIRYLINQPALCREMGAEAGRYIQEKYAIQREVKDLCKLFEKVVRQKGVSNL